VCTIGVPSSAPDRPDPGKHPNDVGDVKDLDNRKDLDEPDDLDDRGDSGASADDYPDDEHELWPGVGPPVPYQGATGEVLHSKWVTFHEGPALLT
jgi:hypothetical protein